MLSQEDIRHVAALARIAVTDEDVERYRHDLARVMELFAELDRVSPEAVRSVSLATMKENASRDDRVSACDETTRAAILANAPKTRDGSIEVKSVF